MSRLIRWFSPLAFLVALAVFASHAVRADDAATTQPSAATGSIIVTVMDSDSNPIVKARVQLYPQVKKSDSDDAAPAKPKAIARAYTGDDEVHVRERRRRRLQGKRLLQKDRQQRIGQSQRDRRRPQPGDHDYPRRAGHRQRRGSNHRPLHGSVAVI